MVRTGRSTRQGAAGLADVSGNIAVGHLGINLVCCGWSVLAGKHTARIHGTLPDCFVTFKW
jgi:hypothetical protein